MQIDEPGSPGVESFDFDTIVDRRASSSVKWDRFAGRDVIPLWVADMDFRSTRTVLEALHRRVDHGVFGYTYPAEALQSAVVDHFRRSYDWTIEPDWLLWLPGVVTGLSVACRAVGRVGDEVLTCSPVYPPFMTVPAAMGRTAVIVPLRQDGPRWTMDLAALERAITSRTRLFLLCQPHNPVGRLWDWAELGALAALAHQHDLIVCSDEIHADLILEPGLRHRPLAMLDPETARRTITLHAPSKSYNIPGLGCSFAVVADPVLRRRLRQAMAGIVPEVNLLGLAAAEAAYRHGEPWRLALIAYLRGNRDLVMAAVATMTGLRMAPVEATYLAWIDTRDSGIPDPEAFFTAAGVGLSDGAAFGLPGFVRLNFACTRSLLIQALERMQRALSSRANAVPR
ncbi:MAG: PatB family C-S lyase [Desulfobulbus sp.]|jgi:cystathionine beta-lyase|nr:PatB family C-S lyase [Desulfobulbus sp.]